MVVYKLDSLRGTVRLFGTVTGPVSCRSCVGHHVMHGFSPVPQIYLFELQNATIIFLGSI